MSFHSGPFVQAACFCELFIRDDTNTLSLIRVIDTLTHQQRGPDAPRDMPPVTHPLKLVLMLKSGEITGRHEVRIVPEFPSGETMSALTFSAHLGGDDQGQNIIADVQFTFTMEGLYWFRVYFDEELLTSMPFRMRYDRQIVNRAQ